MKAADIRVGQRVVVDHPKTGDALTVTVERVSASSLFGAFRYRTADGLTGWSYAVRAELAHH